MVPLRAGNKFAPTLNIRVDELLTTVLRNHPNVEEIEIFHGASNKITGCKEKFNINSYSEVIGDRKNNGEDTTILGGDDEIDDSFFESLPTTRTNGVRSIEKRPAAVEVDKEPPIKIVRRECITTSREAENSESSLDSVGAENNYNGYKDRVARECPIIIEPLKFFISNSGFYGTHVALKPEDLGSWKPKGVGYWKTNLSCC